MSIIVFLLAFLCTATVADRAILGPNDVIVKSWVGCYPHDGGIENQNHYPSKAVFDVKFSANYSVSFVTSLGFCPGPYTVPLYYAPGFSIMNQKSGAMSDTVKNYVTGCCFLRNESGNMTEIEYTLTVGCGANYISPSIVLLMVLFTINNLFV